MTLTQSDLELLKQLKAAGDRGRNVRELNTRVTLDRLVKGGYLVARPAGDESVQYRITQRGQEAIVLAACRAACEGPKAIEITSAERSDCRQDCRAVE